MEEARRAEEEKQEQEERLRRASSKQKRNPWGTVKSEVDKLKSGDKHNQSLLTKFKRNANKGKNEDGERKKSLKDVEQNQDGQQSSPKERALASFVSETIYTTAVMSTRAASTFTVSSSVSSPNLRDELVEDSKSTENLSTNNAIPVEVCVARFSVTSNEGISVTTTSPSTSVTSSHSHIEYCSPFVDLKPSYICSNSSGYDSVTSSLEPLVNVSDKSDVQKSVLNQNSSNNYPNKNKSSAKENELIILSLLRKRSLMRNKTEKNDCRRKCQCSDGSNSKDNENNNSYPKNCKHRGTHRKNHNKLPKSQTIENFGWASNDNVKSGRDSFRQSKSLSESNLSASDQLLLPPSTNSSFLPATSNNASAHLQCDNVAIDIPAEFESNSFSSDLIAAKSLETHYGINVYSQVEAPCKEDYGQNNSSSETECDNAIKAFFQNRGINFDYTSERAKDL